MLCSLCSTYESKCKNSSNAWHAQMYLIIDCCVWNIWIQKMARTASMLRDKYSANSNLDK